MNLLRGVVGLLLFSALYIALPVWGIRKLRGWLRKRRTSHPRRTYKIISLPILLLNAVIGFIGFSIEELENNFDENLFGILVSVICIITLIHAVVQCRLAGLWVGPLRILLGMMIGISAGVAIALALGLIFLLILGDSSQKCDSALQISDKSGNCFNIYRIDDSDNFSSPGTSTIYQLVDDYHVRDQSGEIFDILD